MSYLRECLTRTLPLDIASKTPLASREMFLRWILHEDSNLLLVNKPGWLVVHPSKNGPYSSLVGAAKEYTGLPSTHVVGRLDRETSGVMVIAKSTASTANTVMKQKTYLTLLEGELAPEKGKIVVNLPLKRIDDSKAQAEVCTRDHVHGIEKGHRLNEGGEEEGEDDSSEEEEEGNGKKRGEGTPERCKNSKTTFEPLLMKNGFTLCRVFPETGRLHQIRVHSKTISRGIVGDKVYGPSMDLFLEFVNRGLTDRIWEALEMPRHALHCESVALEFTTYIPHPDEKLQEEHVAKQVAVHNAKLEQRRLKREALAQSGAPVAKNARNKPPAVPGMEVFTPKVLTQKSKRELKVTSEIPLDMLVFCHLKMGVAVEELQRIGVVRDLGRNKEELRLLLGGKV